MKHLFALFLFVAALFWLDRHFLKENDGFCIHYIHGKIPLASVESALPAHWDEITGQVFHYLTHGHQSFVFVSDDGKIILKFYRFPSHLRALKLPTHPFTFWTPKRQKINQYNVQKLQESFQSFQIAADELKKECGLLMTHLAPTSNLHKKIRIIDKLGIAYEVELDPLAFLLQRRAEPFFSHLETLLNDEEQLKKAISSLFQLITRRSQKGIVDRDAILEKNYGFLDGEAIQIDVGRFVYDTKVDGDTEIERIAAPLKTWLQAHNRQHILNE